MKDYPRFTLRINQALLEKIKYISEYEGRTKNKEIERLIRRHVSEFERLHGYIKTSVSDEDIDI